MKISVLGWELPPAFSGGLGIHTINLFTILARVIDINIYVPDSPGLNKEYPFSVTRIPMTPSAGGYGGPTDFFEQVMTYNKLLTKHFIPDVSIVHAHDWITFSAALELKKNYGIKVVTTIHSTEYDRSGNFNPQERILRIEREGIEKADAIIAVSSYTKKEIVDLYGMDENKIRVIHNGVTSSIYSNVRKNYDEAKKVLYFGRVTTQKGPRFFVEAASKVLKRRKDVNFIVAGTGDSISEVKSMVKEFGIESNFEFTGFVSEIDSLKLYRECDVFVLPAVSEPFGMTVLESMSSGTPTVISKTTGVGEALFNALKSDFWDTDKMADYILALLNFKPLRELMGNKGRIEAMEFTWEKAALKTLEVYNSV